jgi:tetratricopeptide (TPR) repeat protein
VIRGNFTFRMEKMFLLIHRKLIGTCLLFFLCTGLSWAETQNKKALHALTICKEQSDAEACSRAIRLGLPPKLSSEAYTFWADSFPNQYGYTGEPVKLLRKAVKLDPNNALATYLLAAFLPNTDAKSVQEKQKMLKRASALRADWEAPHVQLATLAAPANYEEMIREWAAALELAPDDAVYAAKLREAQENFAAWRRDLEEKEEKAKADPQGWAIQAVYSAKFMCNVPIAEKWAEKYNEFHRDGHWPALVLADTYAACGQPEKARAIYRDVIARYEKWMNSELTMQEAIQIQEMQLWYLGLVREVNRLHVILATVAERQKDWWRVKNELEALERTEPTPEIYAQLANALIQGTFPGYESEINTVIEKAVKLDPKFLEKHPDLKSYYKAKPKQ